MAPDVALGPVALAISGPPVGNADDALDASDRSADCSCSCSNCMITITFVARFRIYFFSYFVPGSSAGNSARNCSNRCSGTGKNSKDAQSMLNSFGSKVTGSFGSGTVFHTRLVNALLTDYRSAPKLSRHDGEPWHLHFTSAVAGTEWGAGCATGLAVVE